MTVSSLLEKALNLNELSLEEGIYLWKQASTPELMFAANDIRFRLHPRKEVTWIIDRNINYTNVCYSACKFCNFHRPISSGEAYITNKEEYISKIDTVFELGGNQLLLQGGMHPRLGLEFYKDLFQFLKSRYPRLKLHALGPPEIAHIAKKEGIGYEEVLNELRLSGLDSLPGAGAEILSDRVRRILSPAKCTTAEWLEVMRVAHKLNMLTSATMMFGHIETIEERIQHLIFLRQVQNEKKQDSVGFISFILWPFQGLGTKLHITHTVSQDEYIRMLALSRLMLTNISNIQASWLTVGKATGQLCLHGGANDFGSIMIEENVVSAAGANHQFDKQGIQEAIIEAGFKPVLRNQRFEALDGECL